MMDKIKTKPQLNSQAVSWILIACIVLLVIGMGVGSWFLQTQLSAQFTEADHAKIDAQLSETELQRSKTLETYFTKNQAAIDKASGIVSDTRTYQFIYQDQIIRDLQSYASKASISIQAYTFPPSISTASPADKTGLKFVTASLVFKTPLPYNNFLIFLKYVEQNITKMQVTELSLEPLSTDPNNLQGVTTTIKVYVR